MALTCTVAVERTGGENWADGGRAVDHRRRLPTRSFKRENNEKTNRTQQSTVQCHVHKNKQNTTINSAVSWWHSASAPEPLGLLFRLQPTQKIHGLFLWKEGGTRFIQLFFFHTYHASKQGRVLWSGCDGSGAKLGRNYGGCGGGRNPVVVCNECRLKWSEDGSEGKWILEGARPSTNTVPTFWNRVFSFEKIDVKWSSFMSLKIHLNYSKDTKTQK